MRTELAFLTMPRPDLADDDAEMLLLNSTLATETAALTGMPELEAEAPVEPELEEEASATAGPAFPSAV